MSKRIKSLFLKKENMIFLFLVVLGVALFSPEVFASVESTLESIQSRLTGSVLPLVAILGLLYSAFSFVVGSANAKHHLVLAIIGAVVGFGANSILNFVKSMVN